MDYFILLILYKMTVRWYWLLRKLFSCHIFLWLFGCYNICIHVNLFHCSSGRSFFSQKEGDFRIYNRHRRKFSHHKVGDFLILWKYPLSEEKYLKIWQQKEGVSSLKWESSHVWIWGWGVQLFVWCGFLSWDIYLVKNFYLFNCKPEK